MLLHCVRVLIFGSLVVALLPATGFAQTDKSKLKKLLQDSEFKTVLTQLDSIELDDAELVYWKAISQAATGETEQGLATLKSVSDRWPDSTFAADSNTLRDAMANKQDSAKVFVSQLQKAIESFRDAEYVVRVNADSSSQSINQVFYLGLDLERENCQLLIQQNDKTKFQFELTPDGIRLYSSKEKTIVSIDQKAFFVLLPTIGQNEDGSFSISLKGSMTSDPKDALSKIQEFLSSDWLSTEEGIRKLFVERTEHHGNFFSSTEDDGIAKVRWFRPKFTEAGFSVAEWGFSNGRLQYLDLDGLKIQFLEQIAAVDDQQTRLPAMTWPDVETIEEKMSVSRIARFVSEVGASFSELETGDKKPVTKVAEKPKDYYDEPNRQQYR